MVEVVLGYAIIRCSNTSAWMRNKVLIVKGRDPINPKAQQPVWLFPYVQSTSESLRDALVKNVKEQTGLEVQLENDEICCWIHPGIGTEIHYFKATSLTQSEDTKLDEHFSEFKWVAPASIPKEIPERVDCSYFTSPLPGSVIGYLQKLSGRKENHLG